MALARRGALSVALLLVFIGSLPGICYLLGLASIPGRPQPVDAVGWDRTACAVPAGDQRDVMDPWRYTIALWLPGSVQLSPVQRDAAAIAAGYLQDHPRTGMARWHLANAALTVWITRHWTVEQIVDAAGVGAPCQVRSARSARSDRSG
ncbi:hypothetical protein [Stenotrophomonas rhizophila]|uniref:hypothetical protein n=1 Tax=Stenotrophomonas rhizophila TaxID=216778 RepID=UPI0028A99331|nr:hypothetical protein [Stenotrophomonas rhizophila]